MADVDVGTISDAISVAEDVSLAVDQTPTLYTLDEIVIEEDLSVNIAGAGGGEVVDEKIAEGTIAGENTFTQSILPRKVSRFPGYLNISVSGTFTATVVLQRSFDKGVTWKDHTTYTAATESSLIDQEIGVRYRIGIKTGGYTSGSAVCRLGTGDQL